ncbi:hypothetical protein [Devosia sp. A369]
MQSSFRLLATTAAVCTIFGFTAPAWATDGCNAVGQCIDQEGCSWAANKDGSNIDIITADGTYIHCASATSECTIPRVRPGGKMLASGAANLSRPRK